MTSQPGAPNASAVILFHEETADDKLHMHSEYVRIKVLTEQGKSRADVEIPYAGRYFTITDASGRTIHSDGTIIPFTGKPFDKTIVKNKDFSYKAKVFTLPDVQVGSIIEYRYKLRYDDNRAVSARWYIQSDLYLRQGHYHYVPTYDALDVGHGNVTHGGLSYYQNLPKDVALTQVRGDYDLVVKDIPPVPDEEYLPPLKAIYYRVLFFYTNYRDQNAFWKAEGKYWSKDVDNFANPKALHDVAAQLVSASDTTEQKFRKLYAATQTLENTDYTHRRDQAEEKAEGLKAVKTSIDIWNRKRGTSDELAILLVGLARAVGLKAYAMAVVNRDTSLFNPVDTEMSQLDDTIVVADVDGKDIFLDPGEKYCTYGQLHWKHTAARGIRQTPNGETGFETSTSPSYKDNITIRIAQLTVAEDGSVSGPVRLSFRGARALRARQATITRDGAEQDKYFEDMLREMLPGGLTISLTKTTNLQNTDEPFEVDYVIKGAVGVASSKRLMLPQTIFQSNEKQPFTSAVRTNPIYFDFPYREGDVVQFTLPQDVTVDSLPKGEMVNITGFGAYGTQDKFEHNVLTLKRDMVVGETYEPVDQYQKVKNFFGTVRSRDEDQALLSRTPAPKGN